MRRWLFNLATAVSLGLCVASIALMVRSFFTYDGLDHRHFDAQRDDLVVHGFGSWCGRLNYVHVISHLGKTSLQERESFNAGLGWRYDTDSTSVRLTVRQSLFGFNWSRAPIGPWNSSLVIGAPLWPVTLVTSIPVFLYLHRLRRRIARARGGLCPTCGYDLRATPQRCPECGAVAARDQRSDLRDQKEEAQSASPSD